MNANDVIESYVADVAVHLMVSTFVILAPTHVFLM